MKIAVFLFSLLVAFLFWSATFTPSIISYDFYHWKSTYSIEERREVPKYVKVIDTSFYKSFSFQETNFKHKPLHSIVPVIYLDNSVWSKMKAQTMVSKVLNALEKMPISYNEIQVDCDWSQKSRASYFEFLKLLKLKSTKKISATIRLHQVKYYKKTGVPPIDYGVLMYYNMSDFKDIETKNYILDLDVAKQYHYNFDAYPLALNLALPLYAQATVIRFSKVVSLIDDIREESLDKNFKKIEEHFYNVEKTHYFKGKLFYEGDKIRIDEVSEEMLVRSIENLKSVMKKPKEIIFYRFGNRKAYGEKKLKDIVESW